MKLKQNITAIRFLVLALLALLSVVAMPTTARAQGDAKKDAAKVDQPKQSEESGVETKKVYVIPFRGEFGHDISATPVKKVLEDARKAEPDYLVVELNCAFASYGRRLRDDANAAGKFVYDQLETAREIAVLMTDDIRDSAEWKKKPQLIMWVKRALGGTAFIPFVSRDIYYASEAHHGGIGYMEEMFKGVGDEVAQEKQYSLRLGRAEGLAVKGGYDPRIIKAMSRSETVLSYSIINGKAELYDDTSGDFVLTIDGSKEESKDNYEDIIRFKGKAVLTLDAPTALKLGISKGTVDSMDDLLSELGIARNSKVVKGKAEKIFESWSEEVNGAERDFIKYWKDFGQVQVAGATAAERNKGRAQQIGILKKIAELLKKYKEAINPRAIQGAPAQWENNIESRIDAIQQQIRLDKDKK